MPDWYPPPVGTHVKVFSADMSKELGSGVYDGRLRHPSLGVLNPRITLDSGKQIWGCECWWIPENVFRSREEARHG